MNKYEKYIYKGTIIEAQNNFRTAWFNLFFCIIRELKIDKFIKWLNDILENNYEN